MRGLRDSEVQCFLDHNGLVYFFFFPFFSGCEMVWFAVRNLKCASCPTDEEGESGSLQLNRRQRNVCLLFLTFLDIIGTLLKNPSHDDTSQLLD